MNVLLKVDNREGKLKDLLNEEKICEVVYENLPHGDIQIILDNEPLFLFERKSVSDLIQSIKDGRYKNQKAILFESGWKADQIYYIIEGQVRWDSLNQNNKSINGAIINTLLRDKIGVFFTKDVADTFNLILCMFNRIKKEPKKYSVCQTEQNEGEKKVERQIVTMSINEKTDPERCFLNQLCQIPTISEKTARSIIHKYKTFKNFIIQLSPLSEEDLKTELSKLQTVDDKNKSRKISSKAIKNIIEYIFN